MFRLQRAVCPSSWSGTRQVSTFARYSREHKREHSHRQRRQQGNRFYKNFKSPPKLVSALVFPGALYQSEYQRYKNGYLPIDHDVVNGGSRDQVESERNEYDQDIDYESDVGGKFDYERFVERLKRKFANPTPCDTNLERTVVLVRTFKPTDAMIDRIIDWAVELLEKPDFPIVVYVSIDVTGTVHRGEDVQEIPNQFRRRMFERGVESDLIMFHLYSEDDVERRFPHVTELRKMADDKCGRILGNASCIGWGYHAEC